MRVKIDITFSCGVIQISNLWKDTVRDPTVPFGERRMSLLETLKHELTKKAVRDGYHTDYPRRPASAAIIRMPARPIMIWSDNMEYQNGEEFLNEIKDRKNFGKVTASVIRINRNSGNPIRLYTWLPSEEAHKFIGWNYKNRNNHWM